MPPEGIQVSELTRLAHVRKQTMTQAVEELEQLGYVERRPDPTTGARDWSSYTARASGAADRRGRRPPVDQRWAELTSPREIESLRLALHSLLERLQE